MERGTDHKPVKMNRRITKCKCYTQHRASLVTQMVKNLSAMQETWVRVLGQEDPLEKEMATHSSILAWKIPWTEEPGGSVGSQSTIVILLLMILKTDHIFPKRRMECWLDSKSDKSPKQINRSTFFSSNKHNLSLI